ncbi:RNA-directed DNA polymerase from transposon BS [Paramuricea clavata]|uniref:RNA-directed DNA polymerase from transposon BS n=1 Tax=Paramuricea clavata TaxID=317549 RepID=A0A6S7FLD6_PARCT|nr:RNA-directed DNA polymerase from transposon BS [Paramuricea clavata]
MPLLWFGTFSTDQDQVNSVENGFVYNPAYKLSKLITFKHSTSRRTFCHSRILYVKNHNASFQLERLLLIGNVHPNPGPVTSTSLLRKSSSKSNLSLEGVQKYANGEASLKSHCPVCDSAIKRIHKTIQCSTCFSLIHLSCLGVNLNPMEYFSQSDFVCGMCLQAANTLNLSVSTDNLQLPIGFVFNFDDCLFEDFMPNAIRTDNAIVTTEDEPLFNTSSDYAPLTGFGLKDKGLRVAAYNVQHYTNKVEIIRTILTQTNGLPDILFLIETWLDDAYTDNELEVPGYLLLRKDRSGNWGGGIVAYVRHEISFHRRTDLESNDLEIVWLEINHSNMKPILVAGVYRPPDTNMATDSKLEDNLSQGYFEGKEFYALGDLNINMHDLSAMNHQLVQGLHGMSMTQFSLRAQSQ